MKTKLHKKTRLFVLAALITNVACADLSKYGKVTTFPSQASDGRNTFTYTVDEEFLRRNTDSKKDKEHPKMTQAEAKLLKKLLKEKNFCFDKNEKLVFAINSRQEKIYDITFSHLIEQNYNAKPIAPRMYFGECGAIEKNEFYSHEY